MATLYLAEQGTRLVKRDARLLVMRQAAIVEDIPVIKVDRVVVMGHGVQVSTAALRFLAQQGIPLLYTNQRGSTLDAEVVGTTASRGDVRLAQSRTVSDPAAVLPLVQAIVAGKLANQRALLMAYGREWGGLGGRANATLSAMLARATQTANADQTRGIEGAGAAAYWSAWVAVFQRPWGFQGRAYHPPPDPLNALLSFGYTLLLKDCLTAVRMVGLDPAIGVFHVVHPARPSLALDLQEEFRPIIVDRMVLDLIDSQAVAPAEFATDPRQPGGLFASERVRRVLLDTYERLLARRVRYPPSGDSETLRRVIALQAQQLARVLTGEQATYLAQPWEAP